VLIHRIASLRYPVNDGQGAATKFGGRWNFKGTPITYASESRALCVLEILANKRELAGDYIAIPIEVPSAVIPRERTYLLNPRHADFVRIRFLAPESFRFDPRLAKR
jgi:RES domain-containing protein